jgi:hypothetical protein
MPEHFGNKKERLHGYYSIFLKELKPGYILKNFLALAALTSAILS